MVAIRDGGGGICIGGVTIRNGGAGGVAGDLAAGVEIVIPCPQAPNGLPISSVNSTCFCTTRRASNAGFSRERISLSGNITGLWSCSPPELTNTPGAACRNSPNVIFTAPRELRENFFQRKGNNHARRRGLHDFRAQVHRHRGNNRLQGQLQFIATHCQRGQRGCHRHLRRRGGRHGRAGVGDKSWRFRHDRVVVIQVAQQAPEQPGKFGSYTV